jgi:hypothetical protein
MEQLSLKWNNFNKSMFVQNIMLRGNRCLLHAFARSEGQEPLCALFKALFKTMAEALGFCGVTIAAWTIVRLHEMQPRLLVPRPLLIVLFM